MRLEMCSPRLETVNGEGDPSLTKGGYTYENTAIYLVFGRKQAKNPMINPLKTKKLSRFRLHRKGAGQEVLKMKVAPYG